MIDAFAKVAAAEFAQIALIAVAKADPAQSFLGDPPALLRAYATLDRWVFGGDPLELADLGQRVPHRHFVQDAVPAQLLELDLDVLFAIGDVDDRAFDGVARYGVWRFYFGTGGDEEGEAMAGWRAVARGEPVTGSGLKVRLTPGASPRLAYQSWSRTYPLSVARNRGHLLAKTSEFALRALQELHRSGSDWLEQCRPARNIEPAGAEMDGLELVKDLTSIGRRIVQRGVEKALTVEQWFLAYRLRESRFGDARAIAPDLAGYTRLMPPKDRDWADPFVLAKNGRYFVFFEELPFKAGKAHISMLEIDAAGRASAPVRVLERDYHLSYPFVLEHEGQLYMIPETAQNGTVEAYRCVDFPLRWRLERVLLSGVRCVDATFHRSAERWWMFANIAAQGSRVFDDELHLFHAEHPLGDWQPHARNPVKSDARCARPAGQLYWNNGALYRPAQICAPLYGSGISVNRVLRLTPQDFAERQVERVLPSLKDGILGVHTINRAGDLTVIDAFTRRPRL